MAAFTTWTALYTKLLDDYASGDWRMASYSAPTPGGNFGKSYRTFDEFNSALEYARRMADLESGAASPRTSARPAGRVR